MYRNLISLHFQAFITNKLIPHLFKGLAGLSEDLLESYGDSWSFVDEGGCSSFQYKVLMIFADIRNEIFTFLDICYDKIGITETTYQTCFSSNWTCLEQSVVGSGLGCHIRKSD